MRELGLALPPPARPVASYLQTRVTSIGDGRSLIYVAGQLSREGDRVLSGRCPDQVSVEDATGRAELCALGVMSQIDAAAGLDTLVEMSQVLGFVLSAEGFGDQPKVLNGASDLFVEVLGAAGKHTRAAIGAHALPFSATVEIAAVAVVPTGQPHAGAGGPNPRPFCPQPQPT